MAVGVVGDGPAVEAIRAALADVEAAVTEVEADAVGAVEFALVAAPVGDGVFERANASALEGGTPWIAVELGGVGGYPVVDAAVAGFAPGTACYACLAGRVASNVEDDEEPSAAPDAATVRFAGALAGREAVRLLSEEGSRVLGGVVELPHAERRVLPLPFCDCGSEPSRALERGFVERDLEEALGRAEGALDDRVGVVQHVGETESVPAPYYLARACDTAGFSDATAARDAAGVAADWDAAFMKALGESLERYSAGVYRTAAFESGTPADFEAAVSPSAFVRPEGCEPVDEPIPWVEGRNLDTGGDVHLPAEVVAFPPPEERIRPAITTGLGLGNSTVEAVLSGLYEVVERDAAMLAWYSTFEPLGLEVDDEGFATLASRARAVDLSVTPLLLTQDVDVPVVAVAVHRDAWPRFAVGSGAHLDPARAARSALSEALQNWMELRGMGPEEAAEADGAIGRYADFPEAARAFVDADQTVPAGTVGPEEVPTGGAALDTVVDGLRAAGLDAYAVRLTPRDVGALGFEAVRALAPAAQPLFVSEAYFGRRAREVPADLGFEPRLERDPHPFP